MIRTSGITGCGANALVFLFDQLLIGQFFIFCITPMLLPDFFMKALGKCLYQAVGQDHVGVEVIGQPPWFRFSASVACM